MEASVEEKGAGSRVFFKDAQTFTALFTAENRLSYMEEKFFDARGLKAIEAFEGDIANNLIKWAFTDNSIYYDCGQYWYCFTLVPERKVVTCTRFERGTWKRWDTWMNAHSCYVGKKWLAEKHKDKYVTLFYSK